MNTNSEKEKEGEGEGGTGRDLKPATKSKSKHYFGLAEIGTGLKWREDFRHGLGKGQEEVADCECKAQSTNHRLQFRLDTALRYRYKEPRVRRGENRRLGHEGNSKGNWPCLGGWGGASGSGGITHVNT